MFIPSLLLAISLLSVYLREALIDGSPSTSGAGRKDKEWTAVSDPIMLINNEAVKTTVHAPLNHVLTERLEINCQDMVSTGVTYNFRETAIEFKKVQPTVLHLKAAMKAVDVECSWFSNVEILGVGTQGKICVDFGSSKATGEATLQNEHGQMFVDTCHLELSGEFAEAIFCSGIKIEKEMEEKLIQALQPQVEAAACAIFKYKWNSMIDKSEAAMRIMHDGYVYMA